MHRPPLDLSSQQLRRNGMFMFFSSKLGCLGSILISVLLSVMLLAFLGILPAASGW